MVQFDYHVFQFVSGKFTAKPFDRQTPKMNKLQPKKLMLSKWTAVTPVAKQKHFLVSNVVEPEQENGKVEWIDLDAVHSKAIRRIQWQDLQDDTQWLRGWV